MWPSTTFKAAKTVIIVKTINLELALVLTLNNRKLSAAFKSHAVLVSA